MSKRKLNPKRLLFSISGVNVFWDGKYIYYRTKFDIDADGSPHAYKWNNKGLDDLRNAKDANGNWVGLVTVNGIPVKQGSKDPAPDFYVSTTTYQKEQYHIDNPYRYVNSETVPFHVINPKIMLAVGPTFIGCEMMVTNSENGKESDGVVADVGPWSKTGEGSMKQAVQLGVNPNPRTGGESDKIFDVVIQPGKAAKIDGIQYELQPRHKLYYRQQMIIAKLMRMALR